MEDVHSQHLMHTIQSLVYLQSLETPEQPCTSLHIPYSGGKLLIFDLDETLVHTNESGDGEPVDIVTAEGDQVRAYVNVRPFALDCLAQTSSQYTIGIFTASNKEYADAIIDQVLDPLGILIKFRLYREHCFLTEDRIYIKDLRIIASHSLEDVLLVDNSVHSFGFQLANGIPIVTYFNDPND